jgi:hypothetical protein
MADSVSISKNTDASMKNVVAVVKVHEQLKTCLRESRDYEVCMSLYMTDNVVSCQIQVDNLKLCYTK